ncbi:MAG TPA: hypothetical protein VNF72_04540 [Myxococcota bacterium]|nr:hypothetical protein [Myxococcota bacterium]
MKSAVYSRWDGTQQAFSLDAGQALDKLSELMLEGLSAQEALEWMRRAGFELGGLDMRVMGTEELISELQSEMRALERQVRMDRATDLLRERFEDVLAREQEALRQRHGFESSRMNDFQSRRHAGDERLSDAISRFRDYGFEDEDAGRDFAELLEELERLRALEDFLSKQGKRFRGPRSAGYEEAQQIRERYEALEQMVRALREGNFETISPEELRELLGDDAARSLVMLRDLESEMRRAGYLRGSDPELTPRAIRRIGAHALAQVYAALRQDRPGAHEIDARGASLPRPDETRPFEFGDPLDVDPVRTLLNAVKREALAAPGRPLARPIRMKVEDFAVRERDNASLTTTVLLLDMSWSMSWAGRFPAAKRVALALDHLVRTKYPRDHFFVVGFSTRARELTPRQLPEVSWDMGDPFTNLQEGLMIAERLIARHPATSPQILVVTDGQPTAYFRNKELRVEWPMGFGGVSPHAVAETMKQVRRVTRQGVTINTFMLDDSPELVGFVERMTEVNRGRAFFTSPEKLGSFLLVDYLRGRRKRA